MRIEPISERRQAGEPLAIDPSYVAPTSVTELRKRIASGETLLVRTSITNEIFADLEIGNINLHQSTFDGCEFQNCKFDQTVFIGTSFKRCKFTSSVATHCIFNQADFFQSSFEDTLLAYCDFAESCLVSAKFLSSTPMGNVFRGAWFQNTTFIRTPFGLNDLADTHHPAPGFCSIDLHSFHLTAKLAVAMFEQRHEDPDLIIRQRQLVEATINIGKFLSRCGLPPEIYQLYKELVASPKHDSVFISYSSTDEEFARELQAELSKQGIETWFAPHDMQGGKTILQQITDAIESKNRVVLVLSESSMSSGWVETEIRRTIGSKSGIKKLFPVRIAGFGKIQGWELFDSDSATDLAARIREFYIPDFSEWTNRQKFAVAIDTLAHALRKD